MGLQRIMLLMAVVFLAVNGHPVTNLKSNEVTQDVGRESVTRRSLRAVNVDDEERFPTSVSSITESAAKTASKVSAKLKEVAVLAKFNVQAIGWLAKGIPTADVWANLGLDKMSLEVAKSTKLFKIYTKYANNLDEHVAWAGRYGESVTLFSSTSHYNDEVVARAEIWLDAGRSRAEVTKLLGIRSVHDTSNPFNKYLWMFVQKQHERWAAEDV